MDDDDGYFFPDEPSTDIMRRDRNQKRRKNECNSSSENEREDRIFFEMYNTYRKTEGDE